MQIILKKWQDFEQNGRKNLPKSFYFRTFVLDFVYHRKKWVNIDKF